MSKMCMTCRGQKKVQGLGWMEIECANCDGLGRVPTLDADTKESKVDVSVPVKSAKKGSK
jgi:hypothetical protein